MGVAPPVADPTRMCLPSPTPRLSPHTSGLSPVGTVAVALIMSGFVSGAGAGGVATGAGGGGTPASPGPPCAVVFEGGVLDVPPSRRCDRQYNPCRFDTAESL